MGQRILTFHGVGEPQRSLEQGEGAYWLGLDRFRDILDHISQHPHRDLLSITFDDGNSSDLRLAAPELERRGLAAKFFVLTGRLGRPGSLGASDIRMLGAMGMDIGSHGIAHRDWSRLATTELNSELRASKETLEEICGRRVHSASIPFGRYNAAVLAGLRQAGYETVYSSDGGEAETSRFLQPRTSIRNSMTDSMLQQIFSGHITCFRRVGKAARMTIRNWF